MFANKVIIITGGSSGIGAATAECFAKECATIVIVGRNEAKLDDVAKRCEKLGAYVLTIKADITKDDETETIIKQTIDKFGKLDILINNAGILRIGSILDSNILAIYDEVLNTNLRSTIYITNLAAPYLKETKGNIVNVSSVTSSKVAMPGMGAYSVSKAGMDHFTRSAAVELAPSGVRVNSVNPGSVITEFNKTIDLPQTQKSNPSPARDMTALGRSSEATEIGDLIVYLASKKAQSMTGSCYLIDNGIKLM